MILVTQRTEQQKMSYCHFQWNLRAKQTRQENFIVSRLCSVFSLSVVSNSLQPQWTIACQDPLSMGILQARILEWVACFPPGGFPNPGIEPRSPALQDDSLLSEPRGEPTNTGVGSLSFLSGNFLTEDSNWGLLH